MDTELETQIETLRDTQRKYANILRLARALTSHFYHVIQTQVSISKKKLLTDEHNYTYMINLDIFFRIILECIRRMFW